MATVAIGDIHGNLSALEDLLNKVMPMMGRDDTLVFLGDYIDRGPDTRCCLDRIVRLREEAECAVVTLLGNHEDWMLRTLRDPTQHSWVLGMEAFETIASYSPDVHAGILDDRAPGQQDPETMTWGPQGFPDGYHGRQAVAYGHWDNAIIDETGWPGPCIKANGTFGLDTISHGVLTAMSFPDGQTIQSGRWICGRSALAGS